MTGYFEMVNASGGINGRKITLISLDNGIQLNTSPDDYAPYQSLRMAIFEGSSWKLIDEASAVGQSPAKK